MEAGGLDGWLTEAPLWALAAFALVSMLVAATAGRWLRARNDRLRVAADVGAAGEEDYVITSVLGLLALLLAFTFALAIDRFETRRTLVLNDANAIRIAHLQAHLLAEPHRSQVRRILKEYADNRISLARAHRGQARRAMLDRNDRLIADLWREAAAAFGTIPNRDFASLFIEKIGAVVEFDAARKAARLAHVPPTVFVVLFIYFIVTAGVLGYVLTGARGRAVAWFMLVLLTLSLVLVMDIDRPLGGGIREDQAPMELLQRELRRGD